MYRVDYATSDQVNNKEYDSMWLETEKIHDTFGRSEIGQQALDLLNTLKTHDGDSPTRILVVDKIADWEKFWLERERPAATFHIFDSADNDLRKFINKAFSKHLPNGIPYMRILPLKDRIWIDYNTEIPNSMGYLTDWIPLETALESFKGISDQGEKAIQLIEHYAKLNTENAKSKTKIDFSAILVDLGDNGWEELDRFNSERGAYYSHVSVEDPKVVTLINKTLCQL
ncbi:hypothetical protein PGT21_010413 [Puccinia graminis f. sp. tritici]|uniref:Uncharacterized protein n=1 Tax=Puccinia graminis f. sp. tritici TaxID=56615 RepID=A0A5B0LWY9_PUCGR|nr:hypothetical protein PGT21_010413 [Puccinia graminis f. sp. tritici]KAA1068104.1 hypothetical protein PGTUg99_016868 [Puccinia graminis f. sp. tritici]